MTFSKEDKAAWNASEIMQEFEKIGKDLLLEKSEENEEKCWEDEDDEPIKTLEYPEEKGDLKKELKELYNSTLISNLNKIAAKASSEEATFKVEMVIHKIKELYNKMER